MRLVLLGAPGSGKGTQADRLKQQLAVPHISTGDLLRAAVKAGTPLGLKAKAVMDAGQLVSDDIVLGMLEERLGQADAARGFILDGYPRNLAQCHALQDLLARLGQPLDVAIKLEVPSELIIERIAGRAAKEGRKDDTPETVRERLRVYAEQTEPVASYFERIGKLRCVDGVGELEDISRRVLAALPATAAA
ncbi:MAG: adenylate kinase [Xanthomonadales bacterium]|nr:adenylate kinase [Xanthomonadales bacterium]MCC6595646.1 adenylate kinase [Rhodanobacteraceae bacterium]MDL1869000.1 adenylate kinase [Gammaproteobacteria bacterium PRO6]